MYENPFQLSDLDRRSIWEILVRRDFESFVAKDWSLTEPDFWTDGFFGIDAHLSSDPDQWTLSFPTLNSYRDEWLRQSVEFSKKRFVGIAPLDFLYQIYKLDTIEIAGDRALAHKKFDGSTQTINGGTFTICFQSMYKMMRISGNWKIAGFVGYLPFKK